MKIALCGTSPYSVRLIPYGDPSWKIWGCSPGLYPLGGRFDAWFELHRWEPPTLGNPGAQVPWFSPEYCGWMAQRQHVVWMREHIAAIPNSKAIPHQQLVEKYGHYFFTSSLAWMAAMAIEAILLNRELLKEGDPQAIPGTDDSIGFFGVDMSTEEEYVQQRSGCQFFATLAASMGIRAVVPPESDLLIPPALYGIAEGHPRSIRSRARMDMMKVRKAQADAQMVQAIKDVAFMDGQIDCEQYNIRTWTHEGEIRGTVFEALPFERPIIQDASPQTPPAPPAPEVAQATAAPVVTTAAADSAGNHGFDIREQSVAVQLAAISGSDPHDPQKAETLKAAGLERLCYISGQGVYCRVAANKVCDCIAPIKPMPPADAGIR